MRPSKRAALEAHGWAVGSAETFLGLSAAESTLVEVKLRLSDALRARRQRLSMSQVAVAKRLATSQSRVAKMESSDPTVSIDLLIRALVALGATTTDLANAIRGRRARPKQ